VLAELIVFLNAAERIAFIAKHRKSVLSPQRRRRGSYMTAHEFSRRRRGFEESNCDLPSHLEALKISAMAARSR
jgi:hypothetical protein